MKTKIRNCKSCHKETDNPKGICPTCLVEKFLNTGKSKQEEPIRKITAGFVVQKFDNKGKCLSQEFVSGDQVDFEIGHEPTDHYDYYFPFHMVQPKKKGKDI